MTSALPRPPRDLLGIIGVAVAALVILPTGAVFVVGLIPEINAIWWLGIVILPLLLLVGAVVVVLAIVGIVLGRRRRGRTAFSIAALRLGILMLLPMVLLWSGSL
ncbi:hypothetical protein ACIPVB_10770 [Microbacterium sp. NPDC090007]|uniref:hypothetical protein n=1 Tax=Microbacterium sp. NPDC090007 TaxID=3364204 RepID=UPI0037FD949F